MVLTAEFSISLLGEMVEKRGKEKIPYNGIKFYYIEYYQIPIGVSSILMPEFNIVALCNLLEICQYLGIQGYAIA